MEIKKLRVFRTVVDAGGLTRAAALLEVTPGTVSKALRQLEQQVGQTLFVKVGRSLELSAQGRSLYAGSERLFVEYDRLLESLEAESSDDKPLRLASFEPFTTHTLGAVAARGLADIPLHVLELGVGEIERAVADFEVDLGITYVPRPDRDLEFRSIARTEFGVFCRRDAFLDTSFAELPFAVPVTAIRGAVTEQLTVDSWPPDRRRRVLDRLTSMESALELARRGRCAVFLPTFIAALHNRSVKPRLALRRVAAPSRFPVVRRVVYGVHVPSRGQDPRLLRFVAALAEVIERAEAQLD